MKQTSVSSAWRVSLLTGEVFGGRCDYCNTTLSADAMSQNLYRAHQGHIPALSAWTRILSPEEYRGLELKLRVELFVGRDRPRLEDPLPLPCIVFKLFCNVCWIQTFPVTGSDVLSFRSQHSQHIQAVQVHTVLQNFVGRALQQNICVTGQRDPSSLNLTQATPPSSFALDRAAQLLELSKPLHCTLTGVRCNACKSRYLIKNQSGAAHELALHRCHWDSVHVHALLDKPDQYAGRELELPAYPFSLASWVSPNGATIDCVLVKLFRQHGGPGITPFEATEVAHYIQALEGRRNQPRFLALVRGQGGRAFQCELPVIHVHSASRSFRRVSQLQESFLNPQMENP
jgi:hypothetical protein